MGDSSKRLRLTTTSIIIGRRMLIPLACFTLFLLLACSRIFVWSADGGNSEAAAVGSRSRRSTTHSPTDPCAAASTPAAGKQQLSQLQVQRVRRRPSEWDRHIIFDGANGTLEACPDRSGWLQDQWLPIVPMDAAGEEEQPATSRRTALDSSSSSSSGSARAGFMLPHSAAVQRAIWRHQHPPDCASARFLLYANPALGEGSHGIGSLLHLQTTALLLAINSGRVLVEVPGTYLTDAPYCANRSATTLDSCYFKPLTNCTVTPQQIAAAAFLDAKKPEDVARLVADRPSNASLPRLVRTNRALAMKNPLVHSVPTPFAGLAAGAGVPRKHAYYWWRAQAVAYIVRPNEATAGELTQRKRDKLRGLPLAPGCVSVYIRHGDKGSEHKTYEDAAYEVALQHLRAVDPSLSRQVFLSTEDPATVAYFTNASRNWATSYVDMPRKPNRKKNNIQYMKEHGFAEEMLDGLVNLDLALSCDGFVSSINSNWARLIDELRSTIRCKAHTLYMDVGLRSPKGFFFWY